MIQAQGMAHKYGNHIDTDVIIPARYLNIADPQELATHCMEDLDQNFIKKVQPGDLMIAGDNFGCGSSREHAPLAIKIVGVSCVIAKTFARIFYRNAINIGLPILECPQASDEIEAGDQIQVDFEQGCIKNVTKQKVYQAQPFPAFIKDIIAHEGLLNAIKEKR